MRSDAKASTAGTNQRRAAGRRKPALLLLAVAACVAALAVVVGSASGSTTRFLQETFGSSAEPAFPADRGMAFDQGSEELYVIDSTADTLQRFNANGIAANFSALGSNEIDGEGTGDETPLGHLAFESNRQREQVAIDESGEASDGNVYVTQAAKDVVDIFNGAGEYLGALSESTEGGAFGEPCGVAVDGEGTVYVGDRGDNRIHVFDPAGAVPVNGDSAATSFATLVDPCTMAAGAGATEGFLFVARSTAATLSKLDSTSGELKYEIASGASTVSVDPTTGHVFAARNTGSSSTVDEYDASGATEASLVSSFKPGSTVEGIALSSAAEEVYVARSSTENVEVYGPAKVAPDVVTEAPTANTGTRATFAGTVNPDGVELDECAFEWGEGSNTTPYTETTPCAETPAEIGTGTSPVAVHADISGLKPQSTQYHYRLVATNPNATIDGSNQNFTTPNTVIAEAASGVTPTEATLNGTVNPDTTTLSACVFEWGPKMGPFDELQLYPETTPCVPGPGGITGESPVAAEAHISGLHPGTPYAYRLRATYPSGPAIGPKLENEGGLIVRTLGPAIDAVWSEDVVRTEATLRAEVNPEGAATTYHFEYGASPAYGQETPELPVGSDSSPHKLTRFLSGLEPGVVYHYRVVATSSVAVNEGADHTLTTFAPSSQTTGCSNQVFRTGPSAILPDCRAYELVSPVNKDGVDIFDTTERFSYTYGESPPPNESSIDGNKVSYTSFRAFGEQPAASFHSQYLSERGADGWKTDGINPPSEGGLPFLGEFLPEYLAFSPDLSTAWVRPESALPLAPDAASESINLYRRDNATGGYTTISVGEPTIALPPFGEGWRLEFGGASADGSYALVGVNDKLTPEAVPGLTSYAQRQYYIWHNGELHAVGILPDGTTHPGRTQVGSLNLFGAYQGQENTTARAVSDDGSRVFWTALPPSSGKLGPLYVREHADQGVVAGECTEPSKPCTIPISLPVTEAAELPAAARFWTASADGSKVLFSVGGPDAADNLYLFDVDTEAATKIAKEAEGVAGASDNLSQIYFASKEALAPGATAGLHNFYHYDEGAIELIGMLSLRDVLLDTTVSVTTPFPPQHTSRVTPDGEHIVFAAQSPALAAQVGYDNADVGSGKPAVEVYTYEAGGEVTCASCNPSGARPTASTKTGGEAPLAAAWIPGYPLQYYGRRYISDDGSRVYFNSFDALLPEDTNGVQDVYQWEAQGSGDCEKAGGCVSLISGGESAEVSIFLDASASGDDVFFRTESSLLPQDPGLYDIYDARVGGGFPQPAELAECEGDACQSPPPPPVDPTPSSSSFRGQGNAKPGHARDCRAPARRAAGLRHRARRLQRTARRAASTRRSKRLHRRSVKFAVRARGLSRRAGRCRRANRRTER